MMKLTLSINNSENCDLKIKDTTCGDLGYLPESSELLNNQFKYKDTVSIIQVSLNKISGIEIIQEPLFISHSNSPDWIAINNKRDGWLTIDYIVLPTKEWFDSNQENLESYTHIYYSDGASIYKYFNKESSIVTLEELIEINPEGSTISKVLVEYVSTCLLRTCYINICKKIFEIRGFSKCLTNGNIDSNLIYNRDLIWMTLNIINYLYDLGLFEEALRIIEIFENDCNGICKSYNQSRIQNGCGCSQE